MSNCVIWRGWGSPGRKWHNLNGFWILYKKGGISPIIVTLGIKLHVLNLSCSNIQTRIKFFKTKIISFKKWRKHKLSKKFFHKYKIYLIEKIAIKSTDPRSCTLYRDHVLCDRDQTIHDRDLVDLFVNKWGWSLFF